VALSIDAGLRIGNRDPIDDRFVYATVDLALNGNPAAASNKDKLGIPSTRRYEGLTVYISSEQRNYQFVGGTTDDCFVPMATSGGGGGGTGADGNRWLVTNVEIEENTLVLAKTDFEQGTTINVGDLVLSTSTRNFAQVVAVSGTNVNVSYKGSLSAPAEFSVPEFLIFANDSERDHYFALRPGAMKEGLYVVVGNNLQRVMDDD
jgi:hypothetical protein